MASAVALTAFGGAAVLWQPAFHNNQLTASGRRVVAALGAALLDGSLSMTAPATINAPPA